MEDEEGVLREQNDESLPYGARRTQHTDFDFLSFERWRHAVVDARDVFEVRETLPL